MVDAAGKNRERADFRGKWLWRTYAHSRWDTLGCMFASLGFVDLFRFIRNSGPASVWSVEFRMIRLVKTVQRAELNSKRANWRTGPHLVDRSIGHVLRLIRRTRNSFTGSNLAQRAGWNSERVIHCSVWGTLGEPPLAHVLQEWLIESMKTTGKSRSILGWTWASAHSADPERLIESNMVGLEG
ncbi:hypothetical protein QAD02_020243 [Eretmocerus hayati]|uniref:Uncharacterized protein n=2 Tax=Eretmocerus hayati TaxID=131215 RepID=A0ACC2PN47_9HYME|nr:hypothetical protein QAD02_000899 [Eretmocerus hayati]KAJ8684451.1 hypothetical protein QAD02_020243 [Eretmocerus hayati]